MVGFLGKHGRRKSNIPTITNLTRTEARAALSAKGLNYSESSTNTSDSSLSEKVQSQANSADSVVLYGDTVSYTYYNYVPATPPATPPVCTKCCQDTGAYYCCGSFQIDACWYQYDPCCGQSCSIRYENYACG